MATPALRTRSQHFAKVAYSLVRELKDRDHEDAARAGYGRAALSFPALLRTAGTCQALDFLASRKRSGASLFLDHLARAIASAGVGSGASNDLRELARSSELREYMHLTEILACAGEWFHRFAQSDLGVTRTDEGDGT